MNGIVRSALRASALRGVLSSSSPNGNSQPARALWNKCLRRQGAEVAPLASSLKLYDVHSRRCYSRSHTKGTNSPISVDAKYRIKHCFTTFDHSITWLRLSEREIVVHIYYAVNKRPNLLLYIYEIDQNKLDWIPFIN